MHEKLDLTRLLFFQDGTAKQERNKGVEGVCKEILMFDPGIYLVKEVRDSTS